MHSIKSAIGLTVTYFSWSLCAVFIAASEFGVASVLLQASATFLIFLAYAKHKRINLSFSEALKSLSYSLARVATLCLSVYAYLHLDVGVVSTIGACSVFVLAGIIAPLNGEKFKKQLILPIVSSIVGVALVSGVFNTSGFGDFNVYYLFALGYMIAASLSSFLWRKSVLRISSTKHIIYMHGWTTLLTIPVLSIFIYSHAISSDITPTLIQVLLLVASSLVGTFGDFVFSYAQKFSSDTMNGIFIPLVALFSCLLGWILLNETLLLSQIVGVTIVILSVGYASVCTKNKNTIGNDLSVPIDYQKVTLLSPITAQKSVV